MKRFFCLFLIKLALIILFRSEIHAETGTGNDLSSGDTLKGNQKLYNGRIWRNLYVAIKGDQFLFSNEFLPGTVAMNGQDYDNLMVRYDILNDEIITVTDKGMVLQLNKEMVDGFTIETGSGNNYFLHVTSDSLNKNDGYFHVIYKGRTSLYVRYYKEISKRGPGKNYEDFVQYDRIYIIKENIFHLVRNKRDFFQVVNDKKPEIKEYLRKSHLKLKRQEPDSFVQVLKYYESLIY